MPVTLRGRTLRDGKTVLRGLTRGIKQVLALGYQAARLRPDPSLPCRTGPVKSLRQARRVGLTVDRQIGRAASRSPSLGRIHQRDHPGITLLSQWLKDRGNHHIVATQVPMRWPSLPVGTVADMVVSTPQGHTYVVEIKTGYARTLHSVPVGRSKMQPPMDFADNCALNHHLLQLAMTARMADVTHPRESALVYLPDDAEGSLRVFGWPEWATHALLDDCARQMTPTSGLPAAPCRKS